MQKLDIIDTKTTIQVKTVDFIINFGGHELSGWIDWRGFGDVEISFGEVLPPTFQAWMSEGWNDERLINLILKASEREATL